MWKPHPEPLLDTLFDRATTPGYGNKLTTGNRGIPFQLLLPAVTSQLRRMGMPAESTLRPFSQESGKDSRFVS